MINGQYIVLSFKEWNNFVSQSFLKINAVRIQPLLSSKQSFFNLMNSAADITYVEDNEYILALLSNDYSKYIFQSEQTLASYLNFEAVEQFYALTQRGKIALSHTAKNLHVDLDVDTNIEEFWEEYRLNQKGILDHEKATKFCILLFNDTSLKETLLERISDTQIHTYFNPQKYPSLKLEDLDKKSQAFLLTLESYENTKAFGGMLTRFLIHIEVADEQFIEQYQEISKLCKSKEYYASLQTQQTAGELTSDYLSNQIIREKILSESILAETNITKLPLLGLSLYYHYEMLIRNGYEINLSSLKNDIFRLSFFYENSIHEKFKNVPYLLIYELGKLLPEAYINTLYFCKEETSKVLKFKNINSLKSNLPKIYDEEYLLDGLISLKEEIYRTMNDYIKIKKEKMSQQKLVDAEPHLFTKNTYINESNSKLNQDVDLNNSTEYKLDNGQSCLSNNTSALQGVDSSQYEKSVTQPRVKLNLTNGNHNLNETKNYISGESKLVQDLDQILSDINEIDCRPLVKNLNSKGYTFSFKQIEFRDELVKQGFLPEKTPSKPWKEILGAIKEQLKKQSAEVSSCDLK